MPKVMFNIRSTIMKSGKVEFLEHGFERASIRTICSNAGVTTGALYSSFGSKEELFDAIVSEFIEQHEPFETLAFEEPPDAAAVAQAEMDFIRLAIEYCEDMHLLLFCSKGTSYEGFRDDLVAQFERMIRAYLTSFGASHDDRLVREVAFAEASRCIGFIEAGCDEERLDEVGPLMTSYIVGALEALAA